MIRGVIFDVDGTLVSLKVDGDKLRRVMAEELGKHGFDISFSDTSVYTQDMIDSAKEQIVSGKVNVDFAAVRDQLYRRLDGLELEWSSASSPIDGVVEVLSELRQSSLSIAACTNSGRAPADSVLRRYGLADYFDFVLTRDDVPAMKPHPDGLLRALSLMRLRNEQALYVGDSPVDVRAAKRAGIRVASVMTGRYTPERFRSEGTDYVLNSVRELFGILQGVRSASCSSDAP